MATQNNSSALLPQLFWRLHFWSGVITAPIVLFAAFSGLLYIFTPQIEGWKHASLDQANAIAPAQSVDKQITAAQQAFPGKTIRSIIPSIDTEHTTQVIFGEKKKRTTTDKNSGKNPEKSANKTNTENSKADVEHASHQHNTADTKTNTPSVPFIAYVNPGTLEVQGSIAEDGRFKEWARKLHSTFLQGESWRWIIELSACWMLFMLISGVYLWWPRNGASWRSVLVRERLEANTAPQSRRDWRYFHSIFSIGSLILTFTIIVTGITWAKYAGANFRELQGTLGQSSPKAPMQLRSTPSEQARLSAQSIVDIVQQQVPGIQIQLSPPKTDDGVWRVESYDRAQPSKRFQMSMDAYSGAILYRSGWNDLPILAKATAVGIPFHRGEFGWWNQALLVVVASSVIFAVVSGFVMWFKRRKPQTISAPKVSKKALRAVPLLLWIILAGFAYALPVFGISLALFIIVELMAAILRAQTPQDIAA